MNIPFPSMRNRAIVLFGAAMMLTMTACNKNNDDSNQPDVPVAGLMAFNLAPDVPNAGIALGGNNAVNNLPYGNFTGGYLPVYTGDRSLESYNAASGARLGSGTYTFNDSSYYSVFVVGTNNNYSNVLVEDDITDLTADGSAYVRYINAIPDSTSTPTVTVGTAVNEPAAYKTVSAFRSVPVGALALSVNNGGSINANRSITVEANKIYTVLLSGLPGGTASNQVEIKFITNGTIDANTAGKSPANGSSARSAN